MISAKTVTAGSQPEQIAANMCDKIPMTKSEANRIVHISRRKFRDKYGQYHKPTKDIPRRVY